MVLNQNNYLRIEFVEMKKILTALFLFIFLLPFAQESINFENTTFKELLAKAKKEKKLVFMDAYASWCGPCKLMEKNIFSLPAVKDYYNANFINARFDMEKGEGRDIALKYQVSSFPSFLFLNGDGEVVMKNYGYMDGEDFIAIGKEANNPFLQNNNPKALFEKDESDPTFLLNMMRQNAQSNYTQDQDSVNTGKVYIKANALFLPIGILNAGVEYQIKEKFTLQADVFISPWKSFAGKYMQIYMLGFEGRYYFKEAFQHWYVGANISAARFIMQKYNYWSDGPYQYTPESPTYITSDLYQDGYGFFAGVTAGYQFQLSDRWNMDLYLGAGSAQSFYHGYHKELGIRYDDDGRKWDKSGEFIPYRGGIMISYKL